MIRAILVYPCRCLWRAFVQMTRMTPLRLTILQFSQSFFTDARTFMSKKSFFVPCVVRVTGPTVQTTSDRRIQLLRAANLR